MFKNYIKVALRSLIRHKGYSFINIAGLAVGIASFILIGLYVQYELDYDKFNENYERIYRVEQLKDYSGQKMMAGVTDVPLGPALIRDFPEITSAVRLRPTGVLISRDGNTAYFEENGLHAENSLFEIFTFPLLKGDSKSALSDRFSIVMTERLAQKYFPDNDALGNIVQIEGRFDFTVTAIAKNPPPNSHFTFDYIVPFSFYEFLMRNQGLELTDDWNSSVIQTYVLLHENYDPGFVSDKLRYALKNYTGENNTTELYLKPLGRIHLYSNIYGEIGVNSDITIIYLFAVVAVVTLLIGCANYTNLAVAYSAGRAREIGVRKVVGSFRCSLIAQFLSESLLLSGLATLFAIALVELFLPEFNNIIEKDLSFASFDNLVMAPAALLLILAIGLISGIYPAFYLSSLNPSKVLKSSTNMGRSNSPIRRILVISQLVISTLLIIGTLIAQGQLSFLQNKSLGYDTDNIVINSLTNYDGISRQQVETLKNNLLLNSQVNEVALSCCLPNMITYSLEAGWEGAGEGEKTKVYLNYIDYDYIDTYNFTMKEGRSFSIDFPSDEISGCLINETAVSTFGWDNPLGKSLNSNGKSYTVIGVVKDYHFQPLNYAIAPMMMIVAYEQLPQQIYLSASIASQNISELINSLNESTKSIFPKDMIGFKYLNEQYQYYYDDLDGIIKTIGYFAVLAIFIASLGLYSLVSYMIRQRRREIGIRKVFGAPIGGLVGLLASEFIKMMVIANLIAFPIAYYGFNKLLQNYAYRIDINVGIFLLTGLISFLIVAGSVGYQVIRAALTNPIETLRYE